ncbi:hypothetical protein ACLOJK_001219 [Asimina triloba]
MCAGGNPSYDVDRDRVGLEERPPKPFGFFWLSSSRLDSSDGGLLTARGCDPRIRGLFFHQATVSIPLANISSIFSDVKKLRDMYPTALCGTELYSGFLTRFVKNSTAYLGKTADSLDIDITHYRSRDRTTPRLYEDVLEEIEQMALFKYGGLPHWGKNRNFGFVGARAKFGLKGDKFVAAMSRYDPVGLFSSEWTDGMLGLREATVVIDGKGDYASAPLTNIAARTPLFTISCK